MPVERYNDRVDIFRRKNPNCHYCIANKYYGVIGHVAVCTARQQECWKPDKIAKKCPLYAPVFYSIKEWCK